MVSSAQVTVVQAGPPDGQGWGPAHSSHPVPNNSSGHTLLIRPRPRLAAQTLGGTRMPGAGGSLNPEQSAVRS